jgi:hemerythrin superfamily protein
VRRRSAGNERLISYRKDHQVPDVVTLIENDHRELEEVFTSIEAADGDPKPLLEQVAEMLMPHSKAEEQVVYPAIKQIAPDETEDVDDGLEEHHHVEEMLKQVLAEDSDAPGADGLIAAIIGEVRHHVEEEEQDILPKFAEKATPEQLDELGAKFAEAKERALAELRSSKS